MPVRLFISHASEDKADFVEPLALALREAGYEVWYDKFSLTLGDSLLVQINQGLREADYGVVVLSPSFFRKDWTMAELDGLFALQSTERKVILPIWKDVGAKEVQSHFPMLAGKLAISTSQGIPAIVSEIGRAVGVAETVASFSSIENATSQYRRLDNIIAGDIHAITLGQTSDGVKITQNAATSAMAEIKLQLERISAGAQHLKFQLDSTKAEVLKVECPYAIEAAVRYDIIDHNSLRGAELFFIIYHRVDPYDPPSSKLPPLVREEFRPSFDHRETLIWRCKQTEKSFTTEQFIAYVLESILKIMADTHAKMLSSRGR